MARLPTPIARHGTGIVYHGTGSVYLVDISPLTWQRSPCTHMALQLASIFFCRLHLRGQLESLLKIQFRLCNREQSTLNLIVVRSANQAVPDHILQCGSKASSLSQRAQSNHEGSDRLFHHSSMSKKFEPLHNF